MLWAIQDARDSTDTTFYDSFNAFSFPKLLIYNYGSLCNLCIY